MSKNNYFQNFPVLNVDAKYYLREHHLNDAEAFYQYYRDPEVHQYIVMPVPQNAGEAESRMLTRRTYFQERNGFYWALVDKQTEIMYGSITLCDYDSYCQCATLAYDLAKIYWGTGLAIKMGKTVLDYGFSTLELMRIKANIRVENLRSQKYVQKLGFQYEGTARKSFRHENYFYDMQVYSLLKEDYTSLQESTKS